MGAEFNVEGNPSFENGIQIVWDTVSTDALKTCPRLYQLAIREGWTPKGTNPHLFFGLLTHSAFETYEKAIADGMSHEVSLRLAVRHTLEKSGERKDISKCLNCGAYRPFIAEVPTEQLVCGQCGGSAFRNLKNHFVPWESDDSNKNRWNLLRTVIWYLDNYKNSTEKTVILEDGKPAVEVWFRLELSIVTPEGTRYLLTGHIDRIVDYAGGKWFTDIKTSKNTISNNFFHKFTPNNQMSQYTLAGKVVFDEPLMGGIIDGAQVAVTFSRFQRGFVERTKGQMEEWLRDIQIWIKMAEQYAKDDYWPMNDTACSHYGGCRFQGICGKDPVIRNQFLKTHFERRKWNPLEDRNA